MIVHIYFFQCIYNRCGESAQEHAIEAMPTFQFYRKGKKVHEIMGADPSKLSAAVAKY